MVRTAFIGVLAIGLCACEATVESAPEDIAADAAIDAIADSGLEDRIIDLEAKVAEQETEIDSLQSELEYHSH